MSETKKLRVILADDESHIRMLIKRVILSLNLEIVGEAQNGAQAVELFRKEKADVALLDINMPIMSGDEALKAIIKEFPLAKIIMLTSISDIETIQQCIELGAVNFIRKDTPISEMKEIIKETLLTER